MCRKEEVMQFGEQIYSVKFTQYNKYYSKAEYLYLAYCALAGL